MTNFNRKPPRTKQQYERFVVIKEACGNLFVAGLCSAPAWLFVFLKRFSHSSNHPRLRWRSDLVRTSGLALGGLYLLLIMVGLHRMHAQHVHRQFQYASDLAEKHKIEPSPSDGSVSLESKPDGSDLRLDGQFVGNTPATLKLKPGTYSFAFKASGYKEWSRSINVQPASNVHLSAILEK